VFLRTIATKWSGIRNPWKQCCSFILLFSWPLHCSWGVHLNGLLPGLWFLVRWLTEDILAVHQIIHTGLLTNQWPSIKNRLLLY